MYSDRQLRFFQLQHDRLPEGRFWIPLADQLVHAGRLDEARVLLEKGLGAWPASVSGRWVLARCHLAAGDRQEALEAAGAVLARDPAHAEARALQDELSERLRREQEQEVGTAAASAHPEPAADAPAAGDEARPSAPQPSVEPGSRPAPDPERESAPTPPPAAAARPRPEPVAAESPAVPAAPVPASPAPAPAHSTESEEPTPTFVTRTLADIYLEQGHRDKALQILRQVLAVHPDRDDITARISAIEAGDGQAGPTPPPDRDAANRERFDAWLRREAGSAE